MSRHSHTIVAVFLVACCCYGTALVAEQRTASGAAAAAHAPSHETEAPADARDSRLPAATPSQSDVPTTEA